MKDLGRWILVGGFLAVVFAAWAMGKGKNNKLDTNGYLLLPPFTRT